MTKHLLFQKLIEHHRFNEPNLQKEISSICEYQQLTHGTSLICENQFIKWFVIILDGQVRVWQGNHEHEVTLYYLKIRNVRLFCSSARQTIPKFC